jgi:5-methyltetrahydrofolate--homocysteine methyltransferase
MERRGLDLPLLIGGATTSRQHTAVKIAPVYSHETIHVLDASRVVGVVSDLLDPVRREALDRRNREEQERLRDVHAEKERKPLLPLGAARANRTPLAWLPEDATPPPFVGARTIDVPLETLRDYVDWQFFFTAWELKGRFPAILDDAVVGAAARDLFENAQALLDEIVAARSLRACGVYGFWPASSDGDDIVLYDDNGRDRELVRFCFLRQQSAYGDSRPNRCLADFVAPVEAGLPDAVGAFAVTAGIGADELASRYERAHDDYHAIMAKALADRLAEAFAEYLHERARREWYAADEQLSQEHLVAERYRGIRPAFGYPACPDHTEKRKLFELLRAGDVGIELTESYAMLPAASVSGIYLAHPAARYFSIGRIARDQVEDYARRKGTPVAEVERWLRPHLAYDTEAPDLVPAP